MRAFPLLFRRLFHLRLSGQGSGTMIRKSFVLLLVFFQLCCPAFASVLTVEEVSLPHNLRIKEAKPCREYLAICERSCRERGDMFRFVCIGQDFQPFDDHFRCQCGDDLAGGQLVKGSGR